MRQGKRVRIGWRMILVASGAWGVPSCQVPGLIRAGGQQPEVSEPNKGGCWGRGSALVGVPLKDTPHREFSLSLGID